ncbi:MAG: DEAD/DEAH box helicase [Vicingus serpentipes]|nr:DEAD/DEAH box helicase [Vicingus serpentipes]
MVTFKDFTISKQLLNGLDDLGLITPTLIQEKTYSVIMSGKDVVGIAQTGTGKTLAYSLPLLQSLPFSNQVNPRILILVPTRELVVQVVERIEEFTKYTNTRVLGVYGGANINMQKQAVLQGVDVLVATPGRLYDLALSRAVQLKSIKKLVIDEVDVMLDLGFIFQLTNIFELLPERRQNIMFSATMTEEVDALIDDFFISPEKITVAVSGTPLDNIRQSCYAVPNFYTKVNLLAHLIQEKEKYSKVLVFMANKKDADRIFEVLSTDFESEICVIHANKSQNYRLRSIKQFEDGVKRILITTDVMARGLDLEKISHVFNFNTPDYPENYMHRIGRTGRAEEEGEAILFFTPKEKGAKKAIEELMDYKIPMVKFPKEVAISEELIPDERPKIEEANYNRNLKLKELSPGFHEKKDKNKKVNLGGSYKRDIKIKYRKPKTKGDKNFNRRNKKK